MRVQYLLPFRSWYIPYHVEGIPIVEWALPYWRCSIANQDFVLFRVKVRQAIVLTLDIIKL